MQTYDTQYNAGLSGELRVPIESIKPLPLDEKKVIARRAALELLPNSIVNLGIGLPDAVGTVAGEERVQDLVTLTVDPGVIGGVPLGGADFGAAINFSATSDHPYQFDFIDGGGLDMAYLGFAECDGEGNINASRFAKRVPGCGGFINITQNSKKVVFVGTFTSGGIKVEVRGGSVAILEEGKHRRFVEVAPGIDIERDVLARLPFAPIIDGPAEMDPVIFRDTTMGLRDSLLDHHIEDRMSYDPGTNTVFMNFAGMRVRSQEDLVRIRTAVDNLLEPLDKRVYSIVNYDSFDVAPEVMDTYMDLVRYVEEKYYLGVARYTTSGFMRLKLGKGLRDRRVSSHVFESRAEARAELKL